METLAQSLLKKHFTLSTAESCTGGNIAHLLTLQSGASMYYKGGVVSYVNEVKENLLHVPHEVIERYGVVSREVAMAMAKGAVRCFQSTCAISTTGVSGPTGGSVQIPVGTVCMAVCVGERCWAVCRHFQGTREEVIEQASRSALELLQEKLL